MAVVTPPHAVRCQPSGRSVPVPPGETLLAAALAARQPLASSCGGRAVCGDCLVRVLDGHRHAPAPDADERAWRERSGYAGAGRLACCLRPSGPLDVTTTYW